MPRSRTRPVNPYLLRPNGGRAVTARAVTAVALHAYPAGASIPTRLVKGRCNGCTLDGRPLALCWVRRVPLRDAYCPVCGRALWPTTHLLRATFYEVDPTLVQCDGIAVLDRELCRAIRRAAFLALTDDLLAVGDRVREVAPTSWYGDRGVGTVEAVELREGHRDRWQTAIRYRVRWDGDPVSHHRPAELALAEDDSAVGKCDRCGASYDLAARLTPDDDNPRGLCLECR